jgi:hypothetical protein
MMTPLLHEPVEHLVEDFLRRASRRHDATRVQRHVAFLDTLRRQRPDRGEILRKPYGRHDLGKLRSRLHTEQP